MTLKASAENGAVGSASRVSSPSVFGSRPWIAGTSSGLGRYSITASSSGWTPLFLKAEPRTTGVSASASVPARSARLIISGVTSDSSVR